MSNTTKLFLPAGLKIGSTYLGNVGEQSIDENLDDLVMTPAGDFAPNFTGSKKWEPEFQIEVHEIAAALDLMTTEDLCRTCSTEVVRIVARAMTRLGMQTAVGTGSHLEYSSTNGALVYWESIQCNQGDDAAKLTLKVLTSDNGTNVPLVMTGSVTIDNPAAQVAPFCLGEIKVNGSFLSGVRTLSWQNQCRVIKEASNGSASPGFVAIQGLSPVIRFDTTDLDTVAGYYAWGQAVTELNVWLRRRRPSKINYADSDAQHIKLSATAGTLTIKKISGSPKRAECEIRLHRSTPTTDLFTYAKDQTIA